MSLRRAALIFGLGILLSAEAFASGQTDLCTLILKSVESERHKEALFDVVLQKASSPEGLVELQSQVSVFRQAELIREYFEQDEIPSFDDSNEAEVLIRLFYLLDVAQQKNSKGFASLASMEARAEIKSITESISQLKNIFEREVQPEDESLPTDKYSSKKIMRYKLILTHLMPKASKTWPPDHPGIQDLEPKEMLTPQEWVVVIQPIDPTPERGIDHLQKLYSKIGNYYNRGLLLDYESFFTTTSTVYYHLDAYLLSLAKDPEFPKGDHQNAGRQALLHLIWKVKLASTSKDTEIKSAAKKWVVNLFDVEFRPSRQENSPAYNRYISMLRRFAASYISELRMPKPTE